MLKKQLANTRSSCVYLVHDKVNDIIWRQFSSLLRALLSSSSYKQVPDVSFDLKSKGHCEHFWSERGLDVNKETKWFHLLGDLSGAHLLCSLSLLKSKCVNPSLPFTTLRPLCDEGKLRVWNDYLVASRTHPFWRLRSIRLSGCLIEKYLVNRPSSPSVCINCFILKEMVLYLNELLGSCRASLIVCCPLIPSSVGNDFQSAVFD